jgi:hypothetical protein
MVEEDYVIICKRADRPAAVPSTMELCSKCRASVWLAKSTPRLKGAELLCWDCVPIVDIDPNEIMAPTPEQMADIEDHIEAHMRKR